MTLTQGTEHAGRTLTADVCIIGGGPAGVGVASQLASGDRSVIVLESGGSYLDRMDRASARRAIADHARGAQSATRGRNRGHAYYPLRFSRARGMGGSTAALKEHGLRSRPLDPIDFDSVHGPPWPLPYEEYARYVPEAADLCELPPEADRGLGTTGIGGASGVIPVSFRHGPRDALARAAMGLATSVGQRWILDATATGIHVDPTGNVARVGVTTTSGDHFDVEADQVVLAVGGIDNARVLLSSDGVMGSLGSAANFVGRGFMEHLHYVAGHVIPGDTASFDRVYADFCEIDEELWLTLDDATVRREGLARSAFVPIPASSASLHAGVRAFGRMLRSVPYGPFDRRWWLGDLGDVWRDRGAVVAATVDRVRSRADDDAFVLGAMSEQVPNEESRVTLSGSTDRYGLPLADLRWEVSEEDRRSARRSAELIGAAFEDAGLGRFETVWSDDRAPQFEGGWHHIGTTRMSTDPEAGVVDANSRVHGLGNLFVAGSSVFPSGGFANPTLSVVALSLRLGRHLAGTDPS